MKARVYIGLGAVLALSLAFIAPVLAQNRAATLSKEVDKLSAEIAQLEGARAVKKLQRAFGYYVDRGLWQEACDLFVDDGTIEFGMDGVYVGKARIREYLKRVGGQDGLRYGQLNEYVTLQPVVTISADGRSAKARWRDIGMLGDFHKDAFWRDGVYENDYVLDGGIWKIRSVHLYINFVANYEGGWARMKPAEADWRSVVAKAFPSDKPPTQNYRPFPEPQLVPFHYANPVTGKLYKGQ
jgi:SnoaL-like domain